MITTGTDFLLDARRAFLSVSNIDDVGPTVTAADGTGETGGLRMACQSAGKPYRKKSSVNASLPRIEKCESRRMAG